MNFDKITDRCGTHSSKWDKMEKLYGIPAQDGLAMWTADSDYETAPCVIDAVKAAAEHGVFGYSWQHPEYLQAVQWWMKTRHSWDIETDWVLTSQGLGNAIALCLDVWSQPGDGAVIFSPVYHEFAHKVNKSGRKVTECPLARDGDTYNLDLDDAQSRLNGTEKLLLWCSPQNPSGRVWTAEELRAVAEFAKRNGLILISDEIHHDLVYSGSTFVPMDVAAPDARAWTVTLTAPSKTFNIAGQRTGNMIIPDPELRAAMRHRQNTLDYDPSALGVAMITAAYSPEGAEWVDAQVAHLEGNRRLFDATVNALPGLQSLPLQSTYLAWVDFSGTGMNREEFIKRLREDAKIATSPGDGFGTGGELMERFNLATQRSRVEEACRRLTAAFSDLQ
ncbi:pyridoxal phosphate-dependent aminotransferase [Leisingera sp. HS039]|uniref:MalY/PatB family protein n=1 Tax=unclassified Leisingera TaxID=2614906 RepID=UPI001071397B|nr:MULTISPECIES: MalY/PatB family protein [unclassified Leisingera]MBQ4825402.1 pyridoxal phosphate-dependent aminotransferase [Leisingera sp. HS039]QBR37758.1 pyridoxal phosphate-dependent aminotransferase [Leisingera sp. NJS201]